MLESLLAWLSVHPEVTAVLGAAALELAKRLFPGLANVLGWVKAPVMPTVPAMPSPATPPTVPVVPVNGNVLDEVLALLKKLHEQKQ